MQSQRCYIQPGSCSTDLNFSDAWYCCWQGSEVKPVRSTWPMTWDWPIREINRTGYPMWYRPWVVMMYVNSWPVNCPKHRSRARSVKFTPVQLPWTNQKTSKTLQWRHNGRDSVSNHQPHDCFLSRLFRQRSKKTLKLRVTGLCTGNSPEAGEFPAQMASNAENVSIWWRHHDLTMPRLLITYFAVTH